MKTINRIIDLFSFPYSLYLVIREPGISRNSKIKAGLILALMFIYFLSPADLIPDIIPALGWLDDLLLISLAARATTIILPEINIAELRIKSRSHSRRIFLLASLLLSAMVLISFSVLGWLIYLALRYWI